MKQLWSVRRPKFAALGAMTVLVLSGLVFGSCACSKARSSDGGTEAQPGADAAGSSEEVDPIGQGPTGAQAEALFMAHGIGRGPGNFIDWKCTIHGGLALCLAKRLIGEVGAVPELRGAQRGTFTHARLLEVDGSRVRGADWPAPGPELFKMAEHPKDAPGALPVDIALEFVGGPGDGRFMFKRTTKSLRVLNSTSHGDQVAGSESDVNENDEAGRAAAHVPEAELRESVVVDYLSLHIPRGNGALAPAAVEYFTSLDRPTSDLWLLSSKRGTALLLSVDDGGVESGPAACATLARQGENVSACREPMLPVARASLGASLDRDVDFQREAHRLDDAMMGVRSKPYSFTLKGTHRRVAWYETTARGRTFVSVLTGRPSGLRAFEIDAVDEVWSLGASTVAVRLGEQICVRSLSGISSEIAQSSVVWCGTGTVDNADDDEELEVLSQADGGATLVEEVNELASVREGRSACARITRKPQDFSGCR